MADGRVFAADGSYLEGHGAIIYSPKGVFGTFPTEVAIRMGEKRGIRRSIKALQAGITPELPGLEQRKEFIATLEEILTED